MRIKWSGGWPPLWLMVAFAVWFLATSALIVAEVWLDVLVLLALPIWALATLSLLVLCLWVGVRDLKWSALLLAPGVVACVTLFAFEGGRVSALGYRLRFAVGRPAYDGVIATLRAGGSPPARVNGSEYVEVNSDPPLRVAFVWPGLADNWRGVVYDPSGVVATTRARGSEPGQYKASSEVRELFGVHPKWCEPMDGHYYICGSI
jgi:hypothetical protein